MLKSEFEEYMEEYKKSLDYLTERNYLETDINKQQIVEHTIRQLRHSWFSRFSDYLLRYFQILERNCFGHLEDCEVFLFENNSLAIRKFHGWYYTVKVKEFTSVSLTTESPDDYPFHIMPSEGYEYPEYIISEYLISKYFD